MLKQTSESVKNLLDGMLKLIDDFHNDDEVDDNETGRSRTSSFIRNDPRRRQIIRGDGSGRSILLEFLILISLFFWLSFLSLFFSIPFHVLMF